MALATQHRSYWETFVGRKTHPCFLHSFSKETQHFGSCLSFGEECIPVNLELYIISKTYMQISHNPRSHDSDPGPQEKSMRKSCVSFETECILGRLIMTIWCFMHTVLFICHGLWSNLHVISGDDHYLLTLHGACCFIHIGSLQAMLWQGNIISNTRNRTIFLI